MKIIVDVEERMHMFARSCLVQLQQCGSPLKKHYMKWLQVWVR